MNGFDAPYAVYYVILLVAVAGSLIGMRQPVGKMLKMALAWVAIFGIGFILFSFRSEFSALGQRLRSEAMGSAILEGQTVRIPMAEDGHFWVRGSVDGRTTRFLIDSGASVTALSDDAAKGLDPSGQVAIDTANGTVIAHRVHVTRLEIGPIVREDFPGVTAAEFGDTNVLGMNFLSSLAGWGVEGRTLVLRF